jgi:hypothetical protein
VLRLSNAERRHLYVLAGLNPPAPEPAADHGCEGLRRLIDAWMPYPAHIMDAYYNCVLYNEAAGWVLGIIAIVYAALVLVYVVVLGVVAISSS